jgi:hypothetical protein
MRPSAADYETARRLKLRHPAVWSVSEAAEAAKCTGCVAREQHGTRFIVTVAGCPAHTGEQHG